MRSLILILFILLKSQCHSQRTQTIQLVEVENRKAIFTKNIIQHIKKYEVFSNDYNNGKEITLQVFKYRNSDTFYNIHWGQNDFQFLFSAMDRDNPNRRLKIFPANENQITSFRNGREFIIRQEIDNGFIPISLFIKNEYLEYKYEIIGKRSKFKQQLLIENKEKRKKLKLESAIEKLVTKTHSLKEYSETDYNSFVYSYSSRVAYNFKNYAKKQLKKFKDSIYNIDKRGIKSDMFQSSTFEDVASIKFFRAYNNTSTSNYSPIVNCENESMLKFLQTNMYDIPRACYPVSGSSRCYWVSTEIFIEDFTTFLKRGITIVKTKSGSDNLKFYQDLDIDIRNVISQKLKGYRQGKYVISYQFGHVNSKKISNVVFERL